MASDEIRNQDLMENPDPRVPVCFCLDTSRSMQIVEKGGRPTGEYIFAEGRRYRVVDSGETRLESLQKGLRQFYDSIYNDEDARYGAEISVVTFDDEARILSDFSRVEYNDVREVVPSLASAGDFTSLGAGLNKALDMLEARKAQYRKIGVDYHQPWLVIMTDGEDNPPSGDPSELISARERIEKMVKSKRLCVYPFILGNETGFETLKSLSPEQEPIRIERMNQIQDLFRWLKKSVASVSSGEIPENQVISLGALEAQEWGSKLE